MLNGMYTDVFDLICPSALSFTESNIHLNHLSDVFVRHVKEMAANSRPERWVRCHV